MTKLKKSQSMKAQVVHSHSLPFYRDDDYLDIFTVELGRILVEIKDYKNLTSPGGSYYQLYTYKIRRFKPFY